MRGRKKGDLPGRYVPPHIRKKPNNRREYVNVSGWQEHVKPLPSPLEIVPPQREFDFTIPASKSQVSSKTS